MSACEEQMESIRVRLKKTLKETNPQHWAQQTSFNSCWMLKNLHTLVHQLQELQSYGLQADPDDWNELLGSMEYCAAAMKRMAWSQHYMYYINPGGNVMKCRDPDTLAKF